MNKPIFDPAFWKHRIEEAQEEHHIVYKCSKKEWDEIAEGHRKIIARYIKDEDSVLDLGCGWGRLLDLMPSDWLGDYFGIDISPDLITMALEKHPEQWANFFTGDFLDMPKIFHSKIDWGIMISIRGMIIREMGQEAWDIRQEAMLKVCDQLLVLEYDPYEYEIIEA